MGKIKTILFIKVVVFFCFISCKDKGSNIESNESKKSTTFDFIVDVIVKKNDDLILYYRDGSNEWFDEKHSVWVNVNGDDKIQTVKFSLPVGVLPNNLRFDFSKNPLQAPVKISKIKIRYLNSFFEVKEEEIKNFFEINECVSYNDLKKLYTPHKNSGGIYDPFLLINFNFYIEMDKIIKQE